ncbi:hypothetical protein THAOC_16188, partial [Thalassiosira oceanica]
HGQLGDKGQWPRTWMRMAWAEEDVDVNGSGQRRLWTWTAWAEDVDGLVALQRTMTEGVEGLVTEDMRVQIPAC